MDGTVRYKVNVVGYKVLKRIKKVDYKLKFMKKSGDKVKSVYIIVRRDLGYDLGKECLEETVANICAAGIGDKANYMEFYDSVPGYDYSQKDFNSHVNIKNKVERFLGGEVELEVFINHYNDWLKEGVDY